ncbi:MAG TPA: primosomal protein N' [Thiobacillaceae bacterium]|nr:primosomal protein N' [Thiobacillaceae bacterium]HNU64485.1 primosomal protein N' [Thiobacillaceae bacterium]
MTATRPTPILRVALDTPLDRLFDYRAADAGQGDVGRRVSVPFGRRKLVGVILDVGHDSELPEDSLKTACSIHRDSPPLPADLIELARFAAHYYRHPLGAVLAGILPPAMRRLDSGPGTRMRAGEGAYALTPEGLAYADRLPPRAFAQRALMRRLLAGPLVWADLDANTRGLLRVWRARGWLKGVTAAVENAAAEAWPTPTAEQVAVLARMQRPAGFHVWLLHGITGSGKTEVYLHQVARVLTGGRQALVLVPEIHLTPQLTQRFAQRFPGRRLLSLHSGLAERPRREAWLAALEGRADIVLGTRLAVFTPMPRLGLIVVDEEHDPAFKQMEGMRYSARDVAVWRARQRDVPIILGSATPSLESWRNAQRGRYGLLELSRRAHEGALLPAVRLVDARLDRPRQGLSQALARAIGQRLERGEQSLVFINRRGYAPTLLCDPCGHAFPCPRCSAHLVLHRGRGADLLLCHHCGLRQRPPEACPACGSLDLRPAGQGTQRLEEALAERFPEARLLRIDRDTAARRGAFAAMKARVEARQVDILVGTQIVAKGHDFPHLTLVGIVGADQALVSPDFRAGERLFAQLMQVAGRAGRAGRVGEVLIQTAYPRHPLYQAVVTHDYAGYARRTLRERRVADFPPYASQVLLRAEGRAEAAVMAYLQAARAAAQGLDAAVTLFDPVPALMPRVAHQHRLQLLVQCASRGRLQAFLDAWVPRLRALPASGVRWALDVDPQDV